MTMLFIDLENNIKNYRLQFAISYSDILLVLLSREDFDDVWHKIKPDRKFYNDGRRRINWLIDAIGNVGYTFLNILQPDPDDAPGENLNLDQVTWQQIKDSTQYFIPIGFG